MIFNCWMCRMTSPLYLLDYRIKRTHTHSHTQARTKAHTTKRSFCHSLAYSLRFLFIPFLTFAQRQRWRKANEDRNEEWRRRRRRKQIFFLALKREFHGYTHANEPTTGAIISHLLERCYSRIACCALVIGIIVEESQRFFISFGSLAMFSFLLSHCKVSTGPIWKRKRNGIRFEVAWKFVSKWQQIDHFNFFLCCLTGRAHAIKINFHTLPAPMCKH